MSTHFSRRDMLRIGGAAAASTLCFPMLEASVRAWKRIPIGTQLWCVRKQLATEIPGTLQQLSKLGFDAVELENAFGKSGAEWKSISTRRSSRRADFITGWTSCRATSSPQPWSSTRRSATGT